MADIERALYVQTKRLAPDSIEARAKTQPEMIARLSALHSGTQIEFGVTAGLVEMFITVTLWNGERVVEVVHLPHLAAEWASLIESDDR